MQKAVKSFKKFAPLLITVAVASLCMGLAGGTVTAQAPESSKGAICKEGSGTSKEPCVNPDINQIKDDEQNKNNPNKITCGGNAGVDCGGIITNVVNPGIRILTGVVGIVVAISLVVAAITYGSAGGDPGKVSAAKKRITNTIIALVAYIFMSGLLQWLIPGGLI